MLFPGGRLTHSHKNSQSSTATACHARKYFDLKLDKSKFDSFDLSATQPMKVWYLLKITQESNSQSSIHFLNNIFCEHFASKIGSVHRP